MVWEPTQSIEVQSTKLQFDETKVLQSFDSLLTVVTKIRTPVSCFSVHNLTCSSYSHNKNSSFSYKNYVSNTITTLNIIQPTSKVVLNV